MTVALAVTSWTVVASPGGPAPVFVEAAPAARPATLPSVTLVTPRKDAVVPVDGAPDLVVAFKLVGWKIGAGNHVRLVLDNRASLVVDDASRKVRLRDIDPSPAASAPGQHLLAALLCGPTGEAVKPAGRPPRAPIAVAAFFVGQRSTPAWSEGEPLLVYAGPPAGPAPPEGVLIDFYLVNAELGDRKYSVHAAVTGPDLMTGEAIRAWRPWRIRGARPGAYTVRLELFRYQHELGESGSTTTVISASKLVPGAWTATTIDFNVPGP